MGRLQQCGCGAYDLQSLLLYRVFGGLNSPRNVDTSRDWQMPGGWELWQYLILCWWNQHL